METATETKKELTKGQIRRLELSDLSNQMRDLREKLISEAEAQGNDNEALRWASTTINSMLMQFIYNPNGERTFNTFNQWREQAKFVMKGEKAVMIWGKPIEGKAKEVLPNNAPPDTEPREDNYSMFPLCFLFSDQQVH